MLVRRSSIRTLPRRSFPSSGSSCRRSRSCFGTTRRRCRSSTLPPLVHRARCTPQRRHPTQSWRTHTRCATTCAGMPSWPISAVTARHCCYPSTSRTLRGTQAVPLSEAATAATAAATVAAARAMRTLPDSQECSRPRPACTHTRCRKSPDVSRRAEPNTPTWSTASTSGRSTPRERRLRWLSRRKVKSHCTCTRGWHHPNAMTTGQCRCRTRSQLSGMSARATSSPRWRRP